MKEITDLQNMPDVCVALGFFDSVHCGHRHIIERVKFLSGRYGCKSAVVTFSNNAYKQFNPTAKEVYTYTERLTLFDELALDCVIPVRFDAQTKATDRADFLDYLTSGGRVRAFVCGYDYLFGAGGKGDAEYLRQYCTERGIFCDVIPPVMNDGVRVSTSVIKKLLADGDLPLANRYLTRPFFLDGSVEHGRGVGRLFGIPTANLKVCKDKLLPRCGVYASHAEINGKKYRAVTNIGAKPTFGEPSVTVETFIDGDMDDLYFRPMRLELVRYLRDIIKFESPAELSKQIHKDLLWKEETID